VFACNKNKALQLQRTPVFSILGYNNIGSLAASGSTLLVLRQFFHDVIKDFAIRKARKVHM